MTEQEIQKEIWEIEREYPNLHIDLHRDQFKNGDVNKLFQLYNQLEEVKKIRKGTNDTNNKTIR